MSLQEQEAAISRRLSFGAAVVLVLWLLVRLALVTAVLSRQAAEFIYAGF